MHSTFKVQTAQNNAAPFVVSLSKNGSLHSPILDGFKSLRMKSALINLRPGENVGSHNSVNKEELLIVLEGIGEVHAEGLGKQEVKKDSVIYIPPNNQHDVKNTGDIPLRYIYITSLI
ncbi:MAG TPA: cupin domain-containing protein [Ignavibacteriaceae bacterium]|nr:cupin domain-containing protein [Ignavibacteriaceae bacterium]